MHSKMTCMRFSFFATIPASNANAIRSHFAFYPPRAPGIRKKSPFRTATYHAKFRRQLSNLRCPRPIAYSSLAAGQDGAIYLLFEKGVEKLYETIALVRFNLPWLCEGKDWLEFLPEE